MDDADAGAREDRPTLDEEAALFEEAMRERLAVPARLVAALDAAPRTGLLPAAAVMGPWADADAPGHGGTWDGRVRGRRLGFGGELLWCTLRDWYGWGIPAAEALDLLSAECAATGRMVEVGSGGGYWSAVMAARGVAVTAADPLEGRHGRGGMRAWRMPDAPEGAAAVRANPGVPVLVSWADPGLGRDVVDAMAPGTAMLRTGRWEVTGSNAFNAACRSLLVRERAVPALSCSGGPEELALLRRR